MSEKPYKVVIPGIDGGGAQVFEAETPEEMQEQFRKAQENATAKIRELAQQNELLSQQMQQNAPQQTQNGNGGYDKQQYFNTFYEDPMKAQDLYFQERFGMTPDQFKNEYAQVRVGSQAAIQNQVNAQFAQKHPELLQVSQEEDMHNATEISKILTENGWSYNLKNLEAAYAVAKVENKLKLPNSNPFPEANMIPAPSTISRPTGAVNTSASEAEFFNDPKTTANQIKEYLERKYPNQRG